MARAFFRVYALDVWGNARDGYDVNEEHDTGRVLEVRYRGEFVPDDALIRALRRDGWLDKGVRSSSVEIDDAWPDLTIMDARQPRIPSERSKADPPAYGWGKPAINLRRCNVDKDGNTSPWEE